MEINYYKYDQCVLGAIIGGITGMIGNAQQSANIDKQLNAQQSENQKNREYNYMLAQKQNEWNLEQWMRENEYNLPVNQMKRYKDAGLNPDLIYQQSNLSASSPNMTSGAPSTPMDYSVLGKKPTISQALNSALNASSSMATIRNTDADTSKKKEETKVITKDLQWYDLRAGVEIKLGFTTIRVNESMAELNQQQKEKIVAEINSINKNIELINENITKVRAEVGLIDAQKAHEIIKKNLTEAQIEQVASSTHLNYAQAEAVLINAYTNQMLGQATYYKIGSEIYKINAETSGIRIENNIKKSEYDKLKVVNAAEAKDAEFRDSIISIPVVGKGFQFLDLQCKTFGQLLNGALSASAKAVK